MEEIERTSAANKMRRGEQDRRTTVISPEEDARLQQDVQITVLGTQLQACVIECLCAAKDEALMEASAGILLNNERDSTLNTRKVALLQELLTKELAIRLPGVAFSVDVPSLLPPYVIRIERDCFPYSDAIAIRVKLSWK